MTFSHFSLLPLQQCAPVIFYNLIQDNSEDLKRYFPVTLRENKSLAATRSYIRTQSAVTKQKKFYAFVVIDDRTKLPAGYVLVKNLEWTVPKGELAYFVDQNYRQQGVGSGAVNTVVDFCFQELGLNKLHIMAAEENEASRRLALKCGFYEEGFLKDEFRMYTGELVNVHLLAKLNSGQQ